MGRAELSLTQAHGSSGLRVRLRLHRPRGATSASLTRRRKRAGVPAAVPGGPDPKALARLGHAKQ